MEVRLSREVQQRVPTKRDECFGNRPVLNEFGQGREGNTIDEIGRS
jgi:hypothetical protein